MKLLFRRGKASHCHHAPNPNTRQSGQSLRLRQQLRGAEASLGLFSGETELDQDIHSPSPRDSIFADCVRNPRTVERMHQHEVVERFHLVALQMPDQMPAHRNIDRRYLSQRFLDFVLANVVQPAVVCCSRRAGAVRPRISDDRHLLAMPAALPGVIDAPLYLGRATGQARKSQSSGIYHCRAAGQISFEQCRAYPPRNLRARCPLAFSRGASTWIVTAPAYASPLTRMTGAPEGGGIDAGPFRLR